MRNVQHTLPRPLRAVIAALVLAALVTPPATVEAQRRGRQASAQSRPGSTAPDAPRRSNPAAALRFRAIGPSIISGRISDIAVDPRNKTTWYIGTASGGLWKTTNAGTTWTPIFDREDSYSIGVVVLDPNDPDVIWVGTGENNAQRSVSYGDGVYKSIDGGRSWKNMGLEHSEHIGKIVIDPRNSDVVYVAAQGPLWSGGGDRGLFKTTDGGKTWKKILDDGEWSGASDVVLDPRNPDIVIASTWQRIRHQWGYIAGGPQSGVYRSTDGGATWTKSQSGLPNDQLGRTGLAISPVNPDVVYAVVEAANDRGGFYRSHDNGVSWQRMSDYTAIGLYYQELFPDPVNVDRVYSADVRTMVTRDGGRTFTQLGERDKHPDNHEVWIDPDNTDHLLVGCDGGLYETFDGGETYTHFSNLPLAQFYKVEVDNSKPFYRIYGGIQDNSTVGGPSQTRTASGITNREWYFTAGGDGFQTRVDPKDPNIVYSQSQNGNLSRFNLATGERIDIQPQPGANDTLELRWHWDAPLIISPFSNTRLYFGANKLFRSDDRGDTWRAVSPDLSRQVDRNKLKMMGRVWGVDAVAKNTSTALYGAITSIQESPLKEGLLWIGTDDGLIQVSENGGATWRKVDVEGAPDTAFIPRVSPSSHDVNTVYAVFDNHKMGDFKPYVFKSTDLGRSWSSIASNLPERGTVYVVIDDPKDPNLLYAGTEFGLYYTDDGGKQWSKLGGGLPTIQVRDLAIQQRDDALVVATFGRGFYILDNLSTLRQLTKPRVLASEATLFPVERAPLFVRSRPLGGSGAASLGSRFYTAPNPPDGAQFVYYLKDGYKTRRARRQAAEKAAARKGEDVFYPSWDSLRVEDREEAPEILFTVTDAEGHVVRRLTGPTGAGLQHVSWDLRYPSPNPPAPARGGRGGFRRGGGSGPYVIPGTYRVSMAKRVDGKVTPIGQPQTFEVYQLDGDVPPRSPAILAFQQKTAKLARAVLGANALATETMNQLELLEQALQATPAADAKLSAQVRALESRLVDIQTQLTGDRTAARRSESSPPSLLGRLNSVTGGLWSSTLGDATNTQKDQYEIVASHFGGILGQLRTLVTVDVKQLEQAAEAAGAPWTSGRFPTWDAAGVEVGGSGAPNR